MAAAAAAASKRSRFASSVSIIGFPTRWIRVGATPSASRLVDALGARHEQQRAQLVRQAPVDLLGHRVVEAPQSRLDVGDRDPELGRDERGGERRVHVAVDDDERGLEVQEHRLESDHQRGGLRRLRPRADAQIDVRLGQTEVAEEDVRHRRVVVLAGVDEPLRHASRGQGGQHRRGLHEVGTSPDDVCYGRPVSRSTRERGLLIRAVRDPLATVRLARSRWWSIGLRHTLRLPSGRPSPHLPAPGLRRGPGAPPPWGSPDRRAGPDGGARRDRRSRWGAGGRAGP